MGQHVTALREQIPSASASERATIAQKINCAEEEIEKLEAVAYERKKYLLEQAARFGYSTPPEIRMEIKDINDYFTENVCIQEMETF